MVKILLLAGFITCFTAPIFFIMICQWLNYKRTRNAEIQTDCEDELSLFIGTGFVIFLTIAILTVIGLELCHKVCIMLYSCGIM